LSEATLGGGNEEGSSKRIKKAPCMRVQGALFSRINFGALKIENVWDFK